MKQAIDKPNYEALIFREVITSEELLQSFRLRYAVYRTSALGAKFAPENKERIKVDEWDKYSRQFGLFAKSNDREILVGSMRVIESDGVKRENALLEMARDSEYVRGACNRAPSSSLPFLEYWSDSGICLGAFERSRLMGDRPVEAGCFALQPSFRSIRASKLIVSGVAAAYGLGQYHVGRVYVCCSQHHVPFYRLFGFTIHEGTETQIWDDIKGRYNLLVGSSENLNVKQIHRLSAMATEFDTTGMIRLETKSIHATTCPAA